MRMMKLKLPGSLISLSLIFATGCEPREKLLLSFQDRELISGNASPILLEPDQSTVFLQDYVPDPTRIDSITGPSGLTFAKNGYELTLRGSLRQPLGNLALWSEGQAYSILLKRSKKQVVQLRYEGDAKEVKAKGDFNAWNANNTVFNKEGDTFTATLRLNPGVYQYLFVVDGKEMRDPLNPDSVENGIGGWNSSIRFPRPDRQILPVIETIGHRKNKISLSSTNRPAGVLAYWKNFFLGDDYLQVQGKDITLTIPTEAKNEQRSFIRVWAFNENGVSNDVLVPLEYNRVLTDASLVTRQDKESWILYFMMIDRFNNGYPENDEPVDDPEIHPKANYFGGDLAGVTEKIKDGYFSKLGINSIWLSPITQNPKGAYGKYPDPPTTFSGYHGYWPISSTTVDYRFGTKADLHTLVSTAHDHDMNVILDYVANHVHEEHPVYVNNKTWATDLYFPDGTLNTERWDEYRLTTWFDTFLPTLDLSRPEVVEPMTDSALFWLEEFNLDGFRHDATKHIPLLFWRTLTKKIKSRVSLPNKKIIYQIGETYGSRELIKSYIGSGMLDGQFDFNLYDDAVNVFARDEVPFARLTSSLKESLAYYGDHNLMGNISGNQDRARVISYADGSIRFDEDSKLAGWTREIEVQDSVAYQKLISLVAFNLSIPGIPVIYYGDEIGMPGGNDPDNRRQMRFGQLSEKEQETKSVISRMIHLRKESLPLIYGDTEIIEETERTLILKRSYFGEIVIVLFNKGKTDATLRLDKQALNGAKEVFSYFGSINSQDEDQVEVQVPANYIGVVSNKRYPMERMN